MNKLDWKTLESKKIISDKWINLRSETCKMPNGKIIEPYYLLDYPTWINIVAINSSNEVILVKQYRHGLGKTIIELPSGSFEKNDKTPLDTAKRELLEETGFASNNFEQICISSPNPSNHTNLTYSYLALDVEKVSDQKLDDTEELEIILLPVDKVIEMLLNNKFDQAMHISALFYAFTKLGLIKKI